MYWKEGKTKPKESTTTAIVRQDSRTTVKTERAQSETTSTSVQNATIFDSNTNRVTYRTTRQTEIHQQNASMTVINSQCMATSKDLEEFFQNGAKFTTDRCTPQPAIEYKTRIIAPNSGALPKVVPPKAKITQSTVTQKSGKSNTFQTQEQRIKGDGSSAYTAFNANMSTKPTSTYISLGGFKTSSPTTSSALTPYRSAYASPLLVNAATKTKRTDAAPFKSTMPYVSPYRTISKGAEEAPKAPFSLAATTATPKLAEKKTSNLKPGHVYIFNQESFDNPKEKVTRIGTDRDVIALRQTFERFKLKVDVHHNLKLKKIRSVMAEVEKKDFSKHSCIVVVILTHGTRNDLVAAKDETYSINDDIVYPTIRNKTLENKAKIFIIQACKGDMETGKFYTDAAIPHGPPKDIAKLYSTFEGYVSYRTEEGSIFIQTLCEHIQESGKNKDVEAIMKDVGQHVSKRTQDKQIPSVTTTLSQPYIFGHYT